jgi:hypothetical protein
MCLAVAAVPRGVRLRSAAWNVALLAILWAPPAIQEFTAARGNLSTIARFLALTRPEAAMGWWRGVQTASGLLLPWGPWVGNEHPGMIGDVLPGAAWQVALVGALLFFTAVMAVRIRDGVAVRLVVILFVATLACVAAVVKVRGPPFYYLLLWTRPVAMMLVAGPLLILVRHRGVTFSPRLAPYASLASIGLVLVVVSARAWRAEIPLPLWSRIHANLGKIALREISPRAKVRVVMIGPPYTASAEALCAVFQSAGRNARLTELASAAVGPHRIIGSRIRLPTLVLATGIGIERVPHVERARLLYFNDPLPQKDREEARSLRAKLADQFVALGRADLVPALEAAAPWLWMQSPPGVDAVALGRYTALASGTDKLPVALYSLPAVTW